MVTLVLQEVGGRLPSSINTHPPPPLPSPPAPTQAVRVRSPPLAAGVALHPVVALVLLRVRPQPVQQAEELRAFHEHCVPTGTDVGHLLGRYLHRRV